MLALFGGRQAIQPDVLLLTCPRRVVEGIACTRACRHDPPRGGDRSPWLRSEWQATLVEAALVMQSVTTAYEKLEPKDRLKFIRSLLLTLEKFS